MNDLGLDLDLSAGLGMRTRGRKTIAVGVTVERELEAADIEMAGAERGSKAPDLVKLRDRHHALAKTLAQGTAEGEAAIMCGYSVSRVSILRSDPAFSELVSFYRKGVEEQYYGIHEKLSGLASDSLDELGDRLENRADEFSVTQLMDLTKMGADRTGHGPSSSTTVDVRHGLADKMESARKRIERFREQTIDVTAIDVTPVQESPQKLMD